MPMDADIPAWLVALASVVFVASGVSIMVTLYQSYKRRRRK